MVACDQRLREAKVGIGLKVAGDKILLITKPNDEKVYSASISCLLNSLRVIKT